MGTNIITRTTDIPAVLEAFVYALAKAFDDGDLDDLGAILRTSQDLAQAEALTDPQIAAFCLLRAGFTGSDTDFWAEVAALTQFSADLDAVDEAKRLIRLGILGLGHAPTVTAILNLLGTDPASTVGTWSSEDWDEVAGNLSPVPATAVDPLPAGLAGTTDAEKRASLARLLEEHAGLAFPAARLNAALVGALGVALGVDAVMASNPNVDLRVAKVYNGTPDLALNSDPEIRAAEITALRMTQRLVRIAPLNRTTEAMTLLNAAGVTSALDVARQGSTRFVAAYTAADAGLRAEALEIVSKAQSQTSMAAAFFLQAHPVLGQAPLAFVPDAPVLVGGVEVEEVTDAEVPGWTGLFTTPTGTVCKWCQSIHGPSAYLVDLLHWLDGRTDTGGTSALEHLLERRPDLGNLPLTCENAERVLPYIDLSTEILEAVVAGADLSEARSSEVETSELLAAPQYVNDAAYATGTLGDEIKSFRTPFHRALVEGRTFLGHLGIDRTDLMRAFKQGGAPTDAQIAMEELGLSVEAATAVVTTAMSEADYWSISLTVAPTVRELRRAAEITSDELLDLLHIRSANPDVGVGRLMVLMEVGADAYDISSYSVQQVATESSGEPTSWTVPSSTQFLRLRKVLRLWRATGWSLLELDKVLVALGTAAPTAWDDATLQGVGDVHRLVRSFDLSATEVAAWFGNLDTFEDRETSAPRSPSLYDLTYLSPSLFPASESQATDVTGTYQTFPFALNADRSDVDTVSLTHFDALRLRDHLARLAAVLALDTAEVEALIDALDLLELLDTFDDSGTPTASVTLPNLSRLFRWTSLAGVLGVLPTEALRFATLLQVAPSPSSEGPFETPQDAISFLERVGDLRRATWTIDELEYLLLHLATERAAPTDDYLRGVLGRLRDTARAQKGLVEDVQLVDTLIRQLADEFDLDRGLFDALNTDMWVGALPTASTSDTYPCFTATELTHEVSSVSWAPTTTATLTLLADATTGTGTVPSGTQVTIASTASVSLDTSVVPLDSPCSLAEDGNRFDTTVPAGVTLRLPAGTVMTIVSTVTTVTLTDVVRAETDDAETSLEAGPVDPGTLTSSGVFLRFLRDAFTAVAEPPPEDGDPWADITREAFPNDFAVIEAIHKAAALIRKLAATEDERQAWVERADTWDLLDPAIFLGGSLELRALTDVTGVGGLPRLQNTTMLFAQRSRLPGDVPSFGELIAAPTATALAERTGWDLGMLEELLDSGITSAGQWRTVLDRADLVRRAGADVATVQGWGSPGTLGAFTPVMGREIVAAARSRYTSPDAWGRVARPVRDRIRKAQRDALVSFLIATDATGTFEDADDVYQHYLIDVSMNPEMLTSRIVQASATVQLFVHRCMFGLEVDSLGADLGDCFNDDDRAEWEWTRTYRIWEAARKVFLYPENWIEPELRDDKTPLFDALEGALAQGEVTEDRVEQVMLDYLDGLLGIASLRILACYHEKDTDEDGTTDNFHVFARTRSEPAVYWYRRRVNGTAWTAWEQVNAGVTGDHLIPVVHDRRLLLFWAEFIDTQADEEGITPLSWWSIWMSMSEYRDGTWTPKSQGSVPMSLNLTEHPKSALPEYGFTTSFDESGDLVMACVAARINEAFGGSSFAIIGTFTLNTCTMDLAVETDAHVAMDWRRFGVEPRNWYGPGYWNALLSETSPSDDLAVHLGDVDETGASTGTATSMELLQTIEDATVVVPTQWYDFVSQSPFLVNVGERVYFVTPLLEDEDGLEDAASAEDPPTRGLSTFKAGTSVAFDPPTPITDDDAEDAAYYLEEAQQVGLVVIKDADTALADGKSMVPLAGVLGTYRFLNFYHPFVCRFVSELRRSGIFGLLNPRPEGTAGDLYRQALAGELNDFETTFDPTENVRTPYPYESIDFSPGGAYSQYNWEIFFHLPFYLANQFAEAGRYKEAVDWFHVMFDPRTRTEVDVTGIEGAVSSAVWWKVQPFLKPASAPITDWITFTGADGDATAQEEFEAQVAGWRAEPFNPHLLARLRSGTYQRALVMRYIETLTAWADQLFTLDTLESINEAIQLYVFAKQVLGDRPESLGTSEEPPAKTYNELAPDLDAFSNPIIALENAAFTGTGAGTSATGSSVTSTLGLSTYFCVPFNAKLLSYWDTLEDRLFKVRNGMNIAGVVRSLPLFQPEIDPGMLVRAAAAGLDIGSVVTTAAVGNHRFSVMVQRAQALAGSVRGFGQALLGALEKRDGEALAVLRQSHEEALLDAVTEVRKRQVEDAKESLAAGKKAKALAQIRHDYYDGLIAKGTTPKEEKAGKHTRTAVRLAASAGAMHGVAAGFAWTVPDASIFPPVAKFGGSNISNAISTTAAAVSSVGGSLQSEAGRLTVEAGYTRRKQEWKNQRKLANKELAQHDNLIAAATLRVEIAQRELSNHELQRAHSAQVREWMERKYTKQELYSWMVSQLSALHFQAWQLAYDTARKAEACYNHELGRSDLFVQAVHWNAGRKGLLAGDRLAADLERMDVAYLDNDVRELELVKHVSIQRLDPLALVRLREDGECYIEIPEVLFDLDCPGHYNRRLMGVAVTVAGVSGPQGQVNLRLTLQGSSVRATVDGDLVAVASTYPSIVTSTAQQDAGVFSNDPRDQRYLPFERSGAVSNWHLAFANQSLRQIDWDSVSDVVLHLRYTARDGGATYREEISDAVVANLATLEGGFVDMGESGTSTQYVIAFSAKRDEPDAWFQATSEAASEFTFTLGTDRLPYFAASQVVSVQRVHVLVEGAGTVEEVTLTVGTESGNTTTFAPWPTSPSSTQYGVVTVASPLWPDTMVVALDLGSSALDPTGDLVVVLEITVAP